MAKIESDKSYPLLFIVLSDDQFMPINKVIIVVCWITLPKYCKKRNNVEKDLEMALTFLEVFEDNSR